MPEHNENPADKNGLPASPNTVTQPTADNAGHIYKRTVNRHDRSSCSLVNSKATLRNGKVHIK